MTDSSDGEDFVSLLFRGGSILFIGLVFELGISFFGKLLIARYLGQVDYGAVSLGITTMSLAATFVLSGLYTGIGRYLPRYDTDEERRGVLVSGFQLGLIYALAVGLVISLLSPAIARHAFHDPSVAPIIRIFGLMVPAVALVRLAVGGIQGMKHAIPRVYVENITLPLVRFGGIVLVVILGLSALEVAWAYFASYAAAGTVGVWYLWRKTALFDFGQDYIAKRRELLVFSAPLMLSTAMTFTLAQFDTLLLGFFSPTGHVGIYNVVYPIAQLLTATLSALGFIFMPVVSEMHASGAVDDMRSLYQTATKWLFSATLPLFLIISIFPTMTIKITFGNDYLAGAATLSVLAGAFFVHVILGPNGNTLTSIGKTRLIMYDTAGAAVLNVLLNLVLIPRFSFYGAAVATAISYIAMNVVFSYQLYRTTGIHPFTRALVIPSVIGFVIVGLIFWITRTFFAVTIPLLIAMFVVFVLAYGFAVLRFGIEEEEVRLVMKFEEEYDVDLGPLKAIANRVME